MGNKFEILNNKWISIGAESEGQLVNLNLYSKIYQTCEFNGEHMYLIVFSKESSDGEFSLEYDNSEDWNSDFEELKIALKND